MTARISLWTSLVVVAAAILGQFAIGQTLEPESSIQLPRAVIVDSDTPENVVGQAIVSGNSVTVVLKYGDCPVPLSFQAGELISPSAGYFTTANCTGTPYVRASVQTASPFGPSCGLFLVNADREVYQLPDNAPKNMVTLNSRLTSGGCEPWSPELFSAPTATTPMIADLDDLFVAPFNLQP
ncbi:MAG TPA: hypothetical protein VLK65_18375 [Vicinamibacteria bacterium]|nr:hypothetical protein [Vicinamibacteria bacterium]